MLSVSEEIKNLFLKNNLTLDTFKKFKLTFYGEQLYPSETVYPNKKLFPGPSQPQLVIENDQIESESLTITETLSETEDLKFGSCESAKLEIIVADVGKDVTGQEFALTVEIGGYELALGIYIVKSFVRQADRRKRKIVAYDQMKRFDIDVSSWYNALTFPMALKELRASLMTYVGVEENVDVDYLLNDYIMLNKGADIEEMSGRDLIVMIEEINGVFGHIDRNGVFQHVYLCPTDNLYPSQILFPRTDLYPGKYDKSINVDLTELGPSNYYDVQWEDYTVKSIDSLVISGEDGYPIARYGEGDNGYTIEGNFLLYDMLNSELIEIAYNIFGMISGRSYVPVKSYRGIGLPWVEVGDTLSITTNEQEINTYVLNRTLKGMQALADEYAAEGNEVREFDNSLSRRFTTFQNKARATFKVLDEEIDLRVTYGDVINAINVSTEGIKIQANNISLEGIVTANENFKVLEDGSIEAVNGKFSGDISASHISGTTISGGEVIPFEAQTGKVSIGDFDVNDEYGRHIFQSYDECTGMSTGDISTGEWFLWAGYGYGSGSEDCVFLVNDGQVRVEGELILNGRNILDIIEEYAGSGCDGDTSCSGDCGVDTGCTGDYICGADCTEDTSCDPHFSEGPGCVTT